MQFRQVMGLVIEKLKELGRGSQSGPMARSMDGVVCESSKKQGLSVCVCVLFYQKVFIFHQIHKGAHDPKRVKKNFF